MFEKAAGNCGLPTSFSPLMLYSLIVDTPELLQFNQLARFLLVKTPMNVPQAAAVATTRPLVKTQTGVTFVNAMLVIVEMATSTAMVSHEFCFYTFSRSNNSLSKHPKVYICTNFISYFYHVSCECVALLCVVFLPCQRRI